MSGSANVRKVLLFGFLGALGCLAGWVVGEVFLWAALPASKEAGGSLASKPELPPLANQPAPPAPPPPPALPLGLAAGRALVVAPPPPAFPAVSSRTPSAPPAEFAQRLESAKAKSGDVQITLIWFNVNDLDLHCVDPRGEEIFYARRRSSSGGELDVDMNAQGPVTNRPVENIYWPTGKAPVGKYKVYVNHYANHGGPDPTDYKVSILVGGDRQEFSGKISSGQPKRLINEFEVKAAGPELRLAVSPELELQQAGKNRLHVRLARKDLSGPVVLHFDGDLRGISPREVTIAANETEASAEIEANANAPLGTRTIAVQASAGLTKADASFQLTVKEIPAELLVAVSPELVVNQGGKNGLPVRISRSNLMGPVRVRFDGDLRGISPREFFLGPEETAIAAKINVEASALPGDRTLTLIASAGDLRADAKFLLTVKKTPPLLRLALPSEIQISQEGHNQLPVRIARHGFTGPVTVRLVGDMDDVSPQEFTIPAGRDEYEVTLATDDAAEGTRKIQARATGSGVRAQADFALIVAIPTGPPWSWWLVLIIGLWTALLAVGLSLSLVMGQNWYVARPWLSLGQFAVLTFGGLLAGIIAGGVGQTLYGLLSQIRLVPEIGFMAGWLLLGSLLGRGVVLFIPNLSPWRATAAGSCGGLLGAAAFIALSLIGDMAGRFMGAAILGFALGLMVAIVETAFRKVWLEVVDGPGAVRAVNLGASPVVIGGDGSKCAVLVAGAPGKALKFWEQNGQIYCLDIVAEKTYPVSPGYRHRLKNAEVVVCSNDKGAKSLSAAPPNAPVAAAVARATSSQATVVPIAKVVPAKLPNGIPVAAPANQAKPRLQSSAIPVGKPAPSLKVARPAPAPGSGLSSPIPEPEKKLDSSAGVAARCPVCGDPVKGLPGKRRCSNCQTTF